MSTKATPASVRLQWSGFADCWSNRCSQGTSSRQHHGKMGSLQPGTFSQRHLFCKTADCDQFSYGHPHQLSSMSHPIHLSFDLQEAKLPWGTDKILQLLSIQYNTVHPIHMHINHSNSCPNLGCFILQT